MEFTLEVSLTALRIGVVAADGLVPGRTPPGFEEALAHLLGRRKEGLPAELETVRLAARDMLRNGRYKPTGRGKPASEYLVRAAAGGGFPRITPVVDVANFMSLDSLMPVSLWDRAQAGSDAFVVRLGQPGESYVFNVSGQAIDVGDLVVGAVAGGPAIVNPVKDSQATKTSPATRSVAAVVYIPAKAVGAQAADAVSQRFADWLAGCGAERTAWAVCEAGATVRLEL